MKAIHFVTHFVAPTLLYMGILLYFMAGLCLLASFTADPSFLVVGLISFVLAFNSWNYGSKARQEK